MNNEFDKKYTTNVDPLTPSRYGLWPNSHEAVSGDSTELRMKMERTRANMDATLDNLAMELQPKKIFRDMTSDLNIPGFSDSGSFDLSNIDLPTVARNFSATAKPWMVKHPVSSALLVTGIVAIGLEAAGVLPDTQQASDWSQAKKEAMKQRSAERKALISQRIAEKKESLALASQLKAQQVKDSLQRAKGNTAMKIDNLKSTASDKLDTLKADTAEKIGHGVDSTTRFARTSKDSVVRNVKEHPVGYGLAAVGAGLLIGFSLPQFARQRRQLKQSVKELGQKAKTAIDEVGSETATKPAAPKTDIVRTPNPSNVPL